MDAAEVTTIPKDSQHSSSAANAAEERAGIYVSIPFCRAKCTYCNFASDVGTGRQIDAYVERLVASIRGVESRLHGLSAQFPEHVDTVYFGGGTPTTLSVIQTQRIVDALRDSFSFSSDMEMTFECAPGQLSEEMLQCIRGLGCNRVSLGVQSFIDSETKAVGRSHTAAITRNEIARLRRVGIENINVDLIAGLPHQTRESWRESIRCAIESHVPHLSVYMFDADDDSRLGRELLTGGARYGAGLVPNEETIATMYTEACEMFESAGIQQYEISNFARPVRESRHNLKYWMRKPYIGFGLDAHSYIKLPQGGEIRMATTDDLAEYLTGNAEENVTHVSRTAAMEECWFLGLRLSSGVAISAISDRFGAEAVSRFEPILGECERDDLIERQNENVRLTPYGRLFSNDVFAKFLGVLDECSPVKEKVPA